MRSPARWRRKIWGRLPVAGAWLLLVGVVVTVCTEDPGWAPYLTVVTVAATVVLAIALTGMLRPLFVAAVRADRFGRVAAAIIVVGLVAAIARVPALIRSGVDSARASRVALAHADLDPLAPYGSTPLLAWMARVIPRNATYSVVYGQQYKIPMLCEFWLQPRMFSGDPHTAEWVVVYNQPLPQGIRYSRKVVMTRGIYAVEVAG